MVLTERGFSRARGASFAGGVVLGVAGDLTAGHMLRDNIAAFDQAMQPLNPALIASGAAAVALVYSLLLWSAQARRRESNPIYKTNKDVARHLLDNATAGMVIGAGIGLPLILG